MPSSPGRSGPAELVGRIRARIAGPEPRARLAIPETELFEVLADGRRRAVIDTLSAGTADEPVTRGRLARDIAADELHMSVEYVPNERIDGVADELRRTHLPMMAEADIVRWDRESDEVWTGHSHESVAEWLDDLRRHIEPISDRQRSCNAEVTTPSWG